MFGNRGFSGVSDVLLFRLRLLGVLLGRMVLGGVGNFQIYEVDFCE